MDVGETSYVSKLIIRLKHSFISYDDVIRRYNNKTNYIFNDHEKSVRNWHLINFVH